MFNNVYLKLRLLDGGVLPHRLRNLSTRHILVQTRNLPMRLRPCLLRGACRWYWYPPCYLSVGSNNFATAVAPPKRRLPIRNQGFAMPTIKHQPPTRANARINSFKFFFVIIVYVLMFTNICTKTTPNCAFYFKKNRKITCVYRGIRK